jgi:hypothetical protein
MFKSNFLKNESHGLVFRDESITYMETNIRPILLHEKTNACKKGILYHMCPKICGGSRD